MSGRRRPIRVVTIIVVVMLFLGLAFLLASGGGSQPQATPASATSVNTDAQLQQLFASQASDVQVQGQGTVTRLLADDTSGGRHQRFILKLGSGQTLLITHNIDVAPRLDGLSVGDTVGFYGEYVYSAEGGTIHWTHHDPGGTHVAGWLMWKGQRFS